MKPVLPLLTPHTKWVSPHSLAKPASSISKKLLIPEVLGEARWEGDTSKRVDKYLILQPRTTWFNYHSKPNLAAQGKGDSKDCIIWIIINTDFIISRTIGAEEKNKNCQRHLASILYLRIILISLEFLCIYCKVMCFVFVLRTVSLATQIQTARVHRLDIWILWEDQASTEQIRVWNSKSSMAHSFLKMTSTSTFK